MQTITPFLWFDDQAEPAAKFYASIFKNSKVGTIARYGEARYQEAERGGEGEVDAATMDGHECTRIWLASLLHREVLGAPN